jgi:hypothetical protein
MGRGLFCFCNTDRKYDLSALVGVRLLHPPRRRSAAMRYFRVLLLASSLWVVGATASAQAPSPDRTDDEHIRQTVAAFWQALGDLDAIRLKATLDWPNMLVQTRPDRPTGAGRITTDAVALEAEVRRTLDGLSEGRKGDFYGTTVSTIEARFVNPSVAYALQTRRFGGSPATRWSRYGAIATSKRSQSCARRATRPSAGRSWWLRFPSETVRHINAAEQTVPPEPHHSVLCGRFVSGPVNLGVGRLPLPDRWRYHKVWFRAEN